MSISHRASKDAKTPVKSRVLARAKGRKQLVFKTAFAELCGFELQYDKEKQPSPVMVTGGLDKLEKLWYNHAPNINGSTIP